MIADLALARRIEEDEAFGITTCAQAYGRATGKGVAMEAVGGGWATYAEGVDFLNQAKGVGMQGAVSGEDLDRLEAFYFERDVPAQVVVCPLAHPSLLELSRRGFHVQEFENALAVDPRAVTPAPPTPDVAVSRAAPDELDLWAETCARGFFEENALAAVLPAFRAFARIADVEVFLARVEGVVAGAAALGLREGLAGFFGTSVLGVHRGRGVHRELIRARVESARRLGADLLRVTTLAGSGSQRNFERWGFRPTYTRTVLVKDPR
jgi:GNAT superfamily N-acetyltransferase